MKFSLKCGQSWTTPSCFNNKRKLSKSRTIVSSPKPDEFQYLIPEVPVSWPTWSSHDHVCSRKTLLDELVLVRLYMLWYVQMSWVLLYIVIESEKTGIATSSLLCFMWSVCLTFLIQCKYHLSQCLKQYPCTVSCLSFPPIRMYIVSKSPFIYLTNLFRRIRQAIMWCFDTVFSKTILNFKKQHSDKLKLFIYWSLMLSTLFTSIWRDNDFFDI